MDKMPHVVANLKDVEEMEEEGDLPSQPFPSKDIIIIIMN
jgi:hypothetical protein